MERIAGWRTYAQRATVNRRRVQVARLLVAALSLLFACCIHGEVARDTAMLRRSVSQVWNTSSGLPQDTVHQLLQTHDGFLWIATEGGLVRFDGYDFAVYDKRSLPGLFSSDLVNSLFEDDAGSLWIATSNGLFERSGNNFRRYTMNDGLPSESVWAIGQDAAGHIWVGTSDGLARMEDGKLATDSAWGAQSGRFDGRMQAPIVRGKDGTLWIASTTALTQVSPDGRVKISALSAPPIDITPGPDDALWIATAHSLLRVDRDGSLTTPPMPLGLQTSKIQCLAWAKTGALWIGTSTGLDTTRVPRAQAPGWQHFGKSDGLTSENISKIHAGPADSLSIVTDAGVEFYSQGGFSMSLEQEGFKGGEVLSLSSDREGNLWLGSANAGMATLRRLPFATLGTREGLPTDPVRSLLAVNNEVWLGTAAGLSHLQSPARTPDFSTLTTAQGLASDEILALAPAATPDSLWVGTPDGLSYLEHGRAITLTASDGLPDDNIRSLLLGHDADHHASLWIGTSHGLAILPQADPAQAKSIRTYTQVDGLGSNVIGSLLEDSDGSLWIGTFNGLSHLDHGQIHTYAARDGLTSPIVTALARESGTLWIGTSGGGLFAYENGSIHAAGTIPDITAGRLPAIVYAIVEDGTAHLWISSSSGIYRVGTADLQAVARGQRTAARVAIEHFDVSDGLRLQDCASGGHPEAALTAQGLLWFATQKGASVVDTHDTLRHAAPPVSIENVTVDDMTQEQPANEAFHVPAGHTRLAFHYAGISLATPAKVRYRYQLEHFDREWIEAGTRRTAYYTNIPPGRYTFRVLASINGSDWSASTAAVEFTIAPHYYQTWWFYTLLLLACALIIWQLYLYRLRQVELRFHAVLAERGRIAREIHDTLAQDIVGISVQLELVSRLMTLSVEKAKSQLQETRTLVRKSLEQARSSIWDLRSSAAGDLPTRLRDAAKQITGDSGIALRLDIGGTYRAFSQAIEDELLRIAQEAITNAVRHATPGRIEVMLNYHAKGARLEIHDDGCGFVPSGEKSGPAGHYGIRGMHERADRARGTLEIRSSPGEGTTVIAEAPQG